MSYKGSIINAILQHRSRHSHCRSCSGSRSPRRRSSKKSRKSKGSLRSQEEVKCCMNQGTLRGCCCMTPYPEGIVEKYSRRKGATVQMYEPIPELVNHRHYVQKNMRPSECRQVMLDILTQDYPIHPNSIRITELQPNFIAIKCTSRNEFADRLLVEMAPLDTDAWRDFGSERYNLFSGRWSDLFAIAQGGGPLSVTGTGIHGILVHRRNRSENGIHARSYPYCVLMHMLRQYIRELPDPLLELIASFMKTNHTCCDGTFDV